MSEPRILVEAADVTPDIEAAIDQTVDWFEDSPMPTAEFIDKLCDIYADGWDIESYDNAAVRKIMRIARDVKRERS